MPEAETPHAGGPAHITLVGVEVNPMKISAVKAVRQIANLELKPAKQIIDAVLGGDRQEVPLVLETDAMAVAQRFASLGFVAEIDGHRVEPPEDSSVRQSIWADRERGTVEITEVRHVRDRGLLLLDARVLSGAVASGDDLCIPINESATLALPSVRRAIPCGEGLVRLALVGDDEEIAFWSATIGSGDELLVLSGGGA